MYKQLHYSFSLFFIVLISTIYCKEPAGESLCFIYYIEYNIYDLKNDEIQ